MAGKKPALRILEREIMGRNILHILLVEDDEDDYIILRDMLSEIQGTPFMLEWEPGSENVLEAMMQNSHDVYLVDYLLGTYNGLELMREAIYKGCTAPVIILTGQGDREVDLAAMQTGAADYLVKGQFDARLLERSLRYALERNRLLNKLSDLAIRDELTGLYNRREMKRLLGEEFERHQRHGHHLSLIMIDIDHFKTVNDTFGHPVGDQVLSWLADKLRQSMRALDRPARYGGEEFAIILPETSAQEACQVAERLRQAIAAQSYEQEHDQAGQSQRISITISLGVAEIPGDADEITSLVQAADRALYTAKRDGRNRTINFRSIRT
jgi:diguanylate cyclase (GGDEF)-like protein